MSSDGAENHFLGIAVSVAAGIAVVGVEQNPFGTAGPGAADVVNAPINFADGFESGDLTTWSAAVPWPELRRAESRAVEPIDDRVS